MKTNSTSDSLTDGNNQSCTAFVGPHTRATFDLDIVIDPTEQQLEEFLSRLGDDYYVSSAAAREAFEQRGMFNVVDYKTGIKADFILRKDRTSAAQNSNGEDAHLY